MPPYDPQYASFSSTTTTTHAPPNRIYELIFQRENPLSIIRYNGKIVTAAYEAANKRNDSPRMARR